MLQYSFLPRGVRLSDGYAKLETLRDPVIEIFVPFELIDDLAEIIVSGDEMSLWGATVKVFDRPTVEIRGTQYRAVWRDKEWQVVYISKTHLVMTDQDG